MALLASDEVLVVVTSHPSGTYDDKRLLVYASAVAVSRDYNYAFHVCVPDMRFAPGGKVGYVPELGDAWWVKRSAIPPHDWRAPGVDLSDASIARMAVELQPPTSGDRT